jgi:hypothetical protein
LVSTAEDLHEKSILPNLAEFIQSLKTHSNYKDGGGYDKSFTLKAIGITVDEYVKVNKLTLGNHKNNNYNIASLFSAVSAATNIQKGGQEDNNPKNNQSVNIAMVRGWIKGEGEEVFPLAHYYWFHVFAEDKSYALSIDNALFGDGITFESAANCNILGKDYTIQTSSSKKITNLKDAHSSKTNENQANQQNLIMSAPNIYIPRSKSHSILDDIFKNAESIDAIGLSLNYICLNVGDHDLLRLLNKNCVIRLLFSDPNGMGTKIREQEENYVEGFLGNLTATNIKLINKLKNQYNQYPLYVKTYSDIVRINMYILNKNVIFVSHYLYNYRGADAPCIMIRNDQYPEVF